MNQVEMEVKQRFFNVCCAKILTNNTEKHFIRLFDLFIYSRTSLSLIHLNSSFALHAKWQKQKQSWGLEWAMEELQYLQHYRKPFWEDMTSPNHRLSEICQKRLPLLPKYQKRIQSREFNSYLTIKKTHSDKKMCFLVF